MTREISFVFIRHGRTSGNLEGRYIGGKTDEALSEAGSEALKNSRKFYEALTAADNARLFTGPMARCRETAELLFPGTVAETVPELTEIDFGAFEGKTYAQLNGDPDYQRWIDSGGMAAFPNGESRDEFVDRSVAAFKRILLIAADNNIVVCHDGNIMAIMSALTGGEYFSFHTKNGDGIQLRLRVTGDKIDVLSYDSICGGISA